MIITDSEIAAGAGQSVQKIEEAGYSKGKGGQIRGRGRRGQGRAVPARGRPLTAVSSLPREWLPPYRYENPDTPAWRLMDESNRGVTGTRDGCSLSPIPARGVDINATPRRSQLHGLVRSSEGLGPALSLGEEAGSYT